MALVYWSSNYSVGNDEIDRQHQHIIALVNALEMAAAGEGSQSADLVLVHLLRYLDKHFAAEERLMQAVGYPGLQNHRAEHSECSRRFAELAGRVDAGEIGPLRCVPFVCDWLHEHLLGSDQQYAAWIQRESDAVLRWAMELDQSMYEPAA